MRCAANGKIAWITGAGKGIGRALARRMAEEGWVVAASARTAEDLKSLAGECPSARVHEFPLDVTVVDQTVATLAAIEDRLGKLDLVILNAGTHIPLSADNFSVAPFRHLVETNLMGTVNCLAQVIPKFIGRRQGHIAVVASLAGYRGLPTAAAYGATKAALINMCEALKPELEGNGVCITLINPGFVKTPLTDKNDFPMPFLISVDEAAERILLGLKTSDFEISFPWRFSFLMKVLRLLPDHIFFTLSRRMAGR